MQFTCAVCKKTLDECSGSDHIPTIDLDEESWRSIKQAASESTWMPKEYMKNDWVSDVCRFLKEGPGAFLSVWCAKSNIEALRNASPATTQALIDNCHPSAKLPLKTTHDYNLRISTSSNHRHDRIFDFSLENGRGFSVLMRFIEGQIGSDFDWANGYEIANRFLYAIQNILRDPKNYHQDFRIYFGVNEKRGQIVFYLAQNPKTNWKMLYKTTWTFTREVDPE